MIFKVTHSSDWVEDEPKFESLNTLKELLDFVGESPYPVIIHYKKGDKNKELEI